jgi:hypothetical protein
MVDMVPCRASSRLLLLMGMSSRLGLLLPSLLPTSSSRERINRTIETGGDLTTCFGELLRWVCLGELVLGPAWSVVCIVKALITSNSRIKKSGHKGEPGRELSSDDIGPADCATPTVSAQPFQMDRRT